MARPRKADARDHQINLRFTAPEIVRIHRHAALTGKTVTDFSRAVLLRRPRRRKGTVEPTVIALPDGRLEHWHTLGTRLNAVAHVMNARDDLPPATLLPLLGHLRGLLKKSFATLLAPGAAPKTYSLVPPVRHHLRKVGTNLAQIKRRHEQLGIEAPLALVRLLERTRTLMNGDHAPHDP